MAERVETSCREREKFIQSNLDVTKRRHETVNDKLWNLETKMDTMSIDQAESFCAVQSKLDALPRNSINKEKTVTDKTERQPGTRLDFVEPHRKKQESTPLIRTHKSKGSGVTKMAIKGGVSSSTGIRKHTQV